MSMIWITRRLCMQPTSARDWYVLLIELGERVVRDIHAENPYGKVYRGG